MEDLIHYILSIFYILSLGVIFIYCFGAYVLTKNYLKSKADAKNSTDHLDQNKLYAKVLVQLPVYNEKYVVGRLIESVCKLDYPQELLQIDILDDSDDETTDIIASSIEKYSKKGINIHHKRRLNRTGFKAGALNHFMKDTDCDFIAVFDADFSPPKDFLISLLPHFENKKIGMVQSRWGHINESQSPLTKLQSLALNFHFTIEHIGREKGNYYMNFNGTAGIWRRECIEDAGGWSDKTLTEDLDLSYRAQLKGWKFKYVSDIISDAELPVTMEALKVQQYRWNKGGAQCLKKLFSPIIKSKTMTLKQKVFALIHLMASTTYAFVFFVFVLCFLLVLLRSTSEIIDTTLTLSSIFFVSTILLCYSYWISWKANNNDSIKLFSYRFLLFLVFTSGLSFHNLMAVLSGFWGAKSDFIRTPKFDEPELSELQKKKYFKPRLSFHLFIEIILTLFFILAIINSIYYLDIVAFFVFILVASGFGMISYYQIKEIYMN